MIQSIEKQKITKRRKNPSLLQYASVLRKNQEPAKGILQKQEKPAKRRRFSWKFSDKISFKIPGKFPKFSDIRQAGKKIIKNYGVPAVCGLAVLALIAGTLTYKALNPRLTINLPEDPSLYSHLIATTAVEFDGQGSGDILPAASLLIPAVNPISYVVQSGDTISGIAKMHGLSERTLIGYNNITDVYRLIPGTELNIPDIDGMPYQVRNGDSVSSIAKQFNVEVNAILDANDLVNDVLYTGQNLFIPGARISEYDYRKAIKTLFVYPTQGRLSSGFGYRSDPFTGEKRYHYALDLANRTGTAIVASMEGTVIDVADRTTGYGKSVVIRHANGYQTLYAHMDEILVRKNQWVSQGQLIGRMGNTGRSTGPHLHFSIYKNNVPVNPLEFLLRK